MKRDTNHGSIVSCQNSEVYNEDPAIAKIDIRNCSVYNRTISWYNCPIIRNPVIASYGEDTFKKGLEWNVELATPAYRTQSTGHRFQLTDLRLQVHQPMARYNENFTRMVDYIVRALDCGVLTQSPTTGDTLHWFPDPGAPTSVRARSFKSRSYSLHVAMYAAVRGSIPALLIPKAVCGKSWCVRPDHQELFISGRNYDIPDMRNDLTLFHATHPKLLESGFPVKDE